MHQCIPPIDIKTIRKISTTNVNLTNSLSQTVNVMPDGAIYWYGNKLFSLSAQQGSSSGGVTPITPTLTEQTNSFTGYVTQNQVEYNGLLTFTLNSLDISAYSSLKLHVVSDSLQRDQQGALNTYLMYTGSTLRVDSAYSHISYGVGQNVYSLALSDLIVTVDVNAIQSLNEVNIVFANGGGKQFTVSETLVCDYLVFV